MLQQLLYNNAHKTVSFKIHESELFRSERPDLFDY